MFDPNDIIHSSVCAKLQSTVDGIFGPLEALQKKLTADMNAAKDFLKKFDFSPGKLIHDQCQELLKKANLDKMVPDLKKFDQLVDMINACVFFSSNPTLGYPSSLARGIVVGIKSAANGIIRDITNGLPEFDSGAMLRSLSDQLGVGGLNLRPIIKNLRDGLNCMNTLCGVDVTSRLQKLNGFLSSCCLTGTGTLDFNKLFTDAGLSPDKMNIMNNVMKTYDKIYARIDGAVDNAVNASTGQFNKIKDRTEQMYAKSSALYDKGQSLFVDPVSESESSSTPTTEGWE